MKLAICFLLFSVAHYAAATTKNFNITDETQETSVLEEILTHGLELVLGKLEQMDRKLVELDLELKQYRASQEKTFTDFVNEVSCNISLLLNQSPLIRAYQKTTPRSSERHGLVQSQERVKSFFSTLNRSRVSNHGISAATQLQRESTTQTKATPTATVPTTVAATTTSTTTSTTPKPKQPSYSSCRNVPPNESGVYLISPNDESAPFKVYCEQEKFDGGWIVIQHRFDGSVNFNRNWTEYRDGFGELDNEFWLGLEHIYQLTTTRTHELIVEVKDFQGNYAYARYNAFQVGSEGEDYELKSLGSYSGTTGDALTLNKRAKFSIKGRDHEGVNYGGGWWYGNHHESNLNGAKLLAFTRMMIREFFTTIRSSEI
ncbi:angiopoietin-related protein 1-like [Anopheles albimanus]|uniref:angiopoietin-related protein 1-like n=1 Tax=Anopheles albimanus TaxID=7167 RepID=UPI00163EB29F|nr:angiopoietin-related protein 1-like [Anopheles albimanus]